MFRILLANLMLLCALNINAQNIASQASPHIHSHNDYQHDNPLWDALANGCTSIEIDVFAHKNELKIAHVKFALNIRENFSEMYLKPLIEIIEKRGHIYPETSLILMIDFKTNGDSTLPLLLEAIEPYKEHFSFYAEDSIYQNSLQLVISGRSFSFDQVKNLDSIYVFVDGSVHNCSEEFPDKLVPRGSANYSSIFKWKGKGKMPENELTKLRELVSAAKTCNKELRFYAMPANTRIWHTFLNEGVYWMNIDNIRRFRLYYQEKDSYKFEN